MTSRPGAPLRLAIANDYPVVVAGITAMLQPYADRISVRAISVGEALDADVDVVLFDTFGRVHVDPELLGRLLSAGRTKIVLFSWQAPRSVVAELVARGAAGYLGKDLDAPEIVRALEAIHDGRVVTSSGRSDTDQSDDGRGWPGREVGLSARESEVLALIAQGMTNVEIAGLCFLSINSIKTYIRTAYRKIGVVRRSQAVLWAITNGFAPDAGTDPPRADSSHLPAEDL